jgi:hypothetical protein
LFRSEQALLPVRFDRNGMRRRQAVVKQPLLPYRLKLLRGQHVTRRAALDG